jgi:predicted glycosyltransferase
VKLNRRFVFYTNECVGLGHLRRTVSLAHGVCELDPGATSLIVTGAPLAPEQRLPTRVDTVKLPQLGRDGAGVHRPHRLDVELERVRSLRTRLALAAAETFQPDVAVVDKTPRGLGDELVPTLDALRRSSCRIVLGLRDVEDGPDGVRRQWDAEVREAVLRYYDAVLVYGPPSTPDALETLGWDDLPIPVHHVGYVGRPVPSSPPDDLPDDYVLVTAGGGADGFGLLETALDAIALEPLELPLLLVTGPMMAEGEARQLRDRARGLDARVDDFRADMDVVIARARAVVSMAGYNTVAELLRARRRALLVPRARPSEEQLVRARLIGDAGLAAVLPPDELTPERLRRALDRLLEAEPPEVDEGLYGGTSRAARLLSELAAAPGRPAEVGAAR